MAMESSHLRDVTDLVIYGSTEDEALRGQVCGVREFQVAQALLNGQKELLAHKVDSQWGSMSIFGLCAWFGHYDTAFALVHHGVTGCELEPWHLGPYSRKIPYERRGEVAHCECWGDETCQLCGFGWPLDRGEWMQDGNADIEDAIRVAQKAADTQLFQELLKMVRCGAELPFVSAGGMARLLDIAILIGDKEAAVDLLKTCNVWPLRRWTGDVFSIGMEDNCRFYPQSPFLKEHLPGVVIAALAAGADLQSIHTPAIDRIDAYDWPWCSFGPLPLQTAAFLTEDSRWQECASLFPPWPQKMKLGAPYNDLGAVLLHVGSNGLRLSVEQIELAHRSGLDINAVGLFWQLGDIDDFHTSMLGAAILLGQSQAASEFSRLGVELSSKEEAAQLRRALRESSWEASRDSDFMGRRGPDVPLASSVFERQAAATAAAQVALRASWQREAAEKGVAVYQVARKMSRGRCFPIALLEDILAFSMQIPNFLDELELWDLLHGWVACIASKPLEESEDRNGTTNSEICQEWMLETGNPSGEAVAHDLAPPQDMEVDHESTEKMMTALQESRAEVPALNVDGVCVFRLTRMATTGHINDLLLDATGPLADLHARVLEAGCEVNPAWNPVKALFVPFTETQMAEFRGLVDAGYELNQNDHILALQHDRQVITDALKSHLPFKNRPKVRQVGPTVPTGHDVEESEPLLVLERGLRTDSDVGFPSYDY